MAYLQGNIAKFTVTFEDASTLVALDPTTVTFKYSTNNGATWSAVVTYAGASTPASGIIAKIATGVYVFELDTTGLNGVIIGWWLSTGVGQASAQDTVTVGQTQGTGYTFGDLIERVYRRVMGGTRERAVQINVAAGMGSADLTVVLSGPTNNLGPGVILGVELEEMYITGWNQGTSTATVIRGYRNSVPAYHPDSTLCYINPRYSRFAISIAINDDLRSLSSPTNGLFRVGTAQVTYNAVFQGYDLGALPSNFLSILGISYREVNPARRFPIITDYELRRFIGNTDPAFPSGLGLIIHETAFPGLPMLINYSAPFLPFVSESDNLLMTPGANDDSPPYTVYANPLIANLQPTFLDIPVLGAIATLTMTREISRNIVEAQPDPRKAADVPPGAIANSAAVVLTMRAQRIREEADRLYRQYPDRKMHL